MDKNNNDSNFRETTVHTNPDRRPDPPTKTEAS